MKKKTKKRIYKSLELTIVISAFLICLIITLSIFSFLTIGSGLALRDLFQQYTMNIECERQGYVNYEIINKTIKEGIVEAYCTRPITEIEMGPRVR